MGRIKEKRKDNFLDSTRVAQPSYDQNKPIFGFHNLHTTYCFNHADKDLRNEIINWINTLCNMTWDEIKKKPKETYGYEFIYHKRFKNTKIKPLVHTEKYMVFRINNSNHNTRVLGYREEDKYYLLFLDVKGVLYNH